MLEIISCNTTTVGKLHNAPIVKNKISRRGQNFEARNDFRTLHYVHKNWWCKQDYGVIYFDKNTVFVESM